MVPLDQTFNPHPRKGGDVLNWRVVNDAIYRGLANTAVLAGGGGVVKALSGLSRRCVASTACRSVAIGVEFGDVTTGIIEGDPLAALPGPSPKKILDAGGATNRGVCSFRADTLVLTDGGLLPISDVNTNMSVWSRNPANGDMAWQPVQAQYSNPYEETVSVTMRDFETGTEQTIVSNRIHPYFVQTTREVANSSEGHVYAGPLKNGHWVDAAELQAGDRLLNDDGTWAEVVSVEIEAEPLTAFNLTVAEFHTYFVAANENAAPVWVHNDCLPKINKAVNSNMGHATDRAVERGVFGSVDEARTAYQNLSKNISKRWLARRYNQRPKLF